MNSYDAARMTELLRESHGYQPAATAASADLIILNTCHIREKAEEKLFSELGRLRKATGDRSEVIVAVGGCVGQAVGREIFRRAPQVRLVFGPQNYHELPQMLDHLQRQGGRLQDTEPPRESKFDHLPANRDSGVVGSVTVQEGCDRFCAFCVVPFTRGREWSRPVQDILQEVDQLVRAGALEIQLLGQNVNAYQGHDEDGVAHDLALLIRRVAERPGVERIRFVTSHPADMNDDLVEVFADVEALCPYLHLPIQSGSDRILQRMGRGHTVEEYVAWVDRLRRARPDIALASDFIVGFPGETDDDFQRTLDLVERVVFDHAYSFKYSERPGTAAAELDEPVPEPVRESRLAILQELLNRQQLQRNRTRVGRVEPVLVEGAARKGSGMLVGRAPGNGNVHFSGPATLIGQIVPVEIREGLPNSLRGRMLESAVDGAGFR